MGIRLMCWGGSRMCRRWRAFTTRRRIRRRRSWRERWRGGGGGWRRGGGVAGEDGEQGMMMASEGELEERRWGQGEGDVGGAGGGGDPLVLLGVGGKRGPPLARRAVRAVEEAGVKVRVVGVS